jgi:GAF domain-containing protein
MADPDVRSFTLPDDTIAEMISGGFSLALILEAIVRAVEAALPDVICSILLVDPTGTSLLHGAALGLPTIYNQSVHGLKIAPGIGCCGQAAFTGKRVVVNDVFTHPNWAPFADLARLAGVRASASEPILASDGKRVLGTFALYHKEPTGLSNEEAAFMEQASVMARRAIEHAAVTDPR